MNTVDASASQWFFEDFAPNARIQTAGRTVTETDIVMTVAITGHCQPLFVDEEFAKKTPYGSRIAPIELTIGIMAGLLTRRGILENQIGLLEFSCKAPNPVRAADTLRAATQVIDARLSSKRDRGVVTFDDELRNHKDEVVLQARRVALFWSRPQ